MDKITKRKRDSSLIRNFIFGVQDSFGSTVGFLSGIAVVGVERKTIILAGTVLIFVEAFSMAVGSLLSEHTVEEYENRKALPLLKSLLGPIIMFISYTITGFIPLSPYVLFYSKYSLIYSIIISMIVLSIVGIISARKFKISIFHHTYEMLMIGGLAIIVGVVVGKLFPY